MPGPSAEATVGGDVMASVSSPRDALKQLRKEIKATEAEFTKLAAKGETIDAKLTTRLETMRKKEAAINATLQREKHMAERSKRAMDTAEIAKSIITAQSLGKLLKGEIDARDIASMMFMAERQIVKGVKDIAGVKFAKTTSRVLKAVPFIGEAVSSLFEGWQKKGELEKQTREIETMARAGKIDPATSRLYYASLTANPWNSPMDTVNNVVSASRQLNELSRNDVKKTLQKFKFKRWQRGEFGTQGKYVEDSIQADKIINNYEQFLENDKLNGVIITKERQETAMRSAISSALENDDMRDDIAEQLYESVKEKLISKREDDEYLIKTKFDREENERQARVAAARHAIPARLDF